MKICLAHPTTLYLGKEYVPVSCFAKRPCVYIYTPQNCTHIRCSNTFIY